MLTCTHVCPHASCGCPVRGEELGVRSRLVITSTRQRQHLLSTAVMYLEERVLRMPVIRPHVGHDLRLRFGGPNRGALGSDPIDEQG
jgi:hypothetical protein